MGQLITFLFFFSVWGPTKSRNQRALPLHQLQFFALSIACNFSTQSPEALMQVDLGARIAERCAAWRAGQWFVGDIRVQCRVRLGWQSHGVSDACFGRRGGSRGGTGTSVNMIARGSYLPFVR